MAGSCFGNKLCNVVNELHHDSFVVKYATFVRARSFVKPFVIPFVGAIGWVYLSPRGQGMAELFCVSRPP
jgi:hypothetical protein